MYDYNENGRMGAVYDELGALKRGRMLQQWSLQDSYDLHHPRIPYKVSIEKNALIEAIPATHVEMSRPITPLVLKVKIPL